MNAELITVISVGATLWLSTSTTAYLKWTLPALRRVEWPEDSEGYVTGMYLGLFVASYTRVVSAFKLLCTVTDNDEVIQDLVNQINENLKNRGF